MSTNKKRVLTIITAAVAMLTLISIYLLGSTYAKYLSVESGATASATVADWSVKFNGEADSEASYSEVVTFGDLSPSENNPTAETESAAAVPVSNSTGLKLVAVLSIEADVNATIEFSYSDLAYTMVSDEVTFTSANANSGFTVKDGEVCTAPKQTEVDKLFSLSLTCYNDSNKSSSVDLTENDNNIYTLTYTAVDENGTATGKVTYYIYATLTWTTTYLGDSNEHHLLDTWVAENIDTVSTTVTATATQSSVVPTSD